MRLSALIAVPVLLATTLVAADDNHERDFLSRIRRLTVAGR